MKENPTVTSVGGAEIPALLSVSPCTSIRCSSARIGPSVAWYISLIRSSDQTVSICQRVTPLFSFQQGPEKRSILPARAGCGTPGGVMAA